MAIARLVLTVIILAVAITSALLGMHSNSGPRPQVATSPPSTPTQSLGARTKTTGCTIVTGQQDPACTPGAIIPTVTVAQICTSGYSSSVRNVSTQTKHDTYAEYGIASHTPGQYEVDHLVSLELGGSNDIANLWPETADPAPGFHEKDQVENYLHDQVCAGAMTLATAQDQIAHDWLGVYSKIHGG